MKRRELLTQAWLDVTVDYLGPLLSAHYLFVVLYSILAGIKK